MLRECLEPFILAKTGTGRTALCHLKMDGLSLTLAIVCLAPTSVSITWLRMRENDVITGTQQTTLLVTSSRSRIACARTCSVLDWCSVFAADDMARTCELRDLPRISLNFSSKSPYSSRWRLLNEWCPVNNGFYFSASIHFCFTMVTNLNATWTESRNECIRRGLDLVVLDTTLKLKIVLNIIKNTPGGTNYTYYLGATRPMADIGAVWKGDKKTFEWINGANLSLSNDTWAVNQPNNYGGVQNCLVWHHSARRRE
ncbi:uncharacterized protein LOC112575469 isoform X2 [Pomacea canaliculata]|uniref:uncharacterized protein LOC112575469 isoform X2 n=1 Tax=Pomacea canaliculata TaxID=400727 RepID=UPI000D72BFD8|nr:uncharacterized protein LOC112575469 isoform X2 [Pomacea canaliculata]